jgi:tetratricopeptide (TPR) repeat protein
MSTTLRLVDCLWSRCCTLMETGQMAQLRPLLQRLLQLELPRTIRAEATLMLAELLRVQGEYQAARRHVSAALAGDPEDPSLHHLLGYLHEEDAETGSSRVALQHLRKAVRLAPDSGECHRALGEMLRTQGREAVGLSHLKKAVRLEPENLDNLRCLIQAFVESGHEEEARQTVRQLQFRMGKAHPDVQALWNDLTFAIAHQQTQQDQRPATVPLLKVVAEKSSRTKRPESPPRILRFDAAHAHRPRQPRRVKQE